MRTFRLITAVLVVAVLSVGVASAVDGVLEGSHADVQAVSTAAPDIRLTEFPSADAPWVPIPGTTITVIVRSRSALVTVWDGGGTRMIEEAAGCPSLEGARRSFLVMLTRPDGTEE